MRVFSRKCGIGLLLIACTGLIAELPALSNATASSRSRLVTFQAALERDLKSAEAVRWADNEHLYSVFETHSEPHRWAGVLDLNGTFRVLQDEIDLVSYAPDGNTVLFHRQKGWTLRGLASGDEVSLVTEPASDEREFNAGYQPIWSGDGRFAAIIESYTPSRLPNNTKRIAPNGIPVVDLDQQKSPLTEWVTRLSIVDRDNPTSLRRITLSGLARQCSWGTDHTLYVVQVQLADKNPSTIIYRLLPNGDAPEEVYRTRGRIQRMRPAVHPGGKRIAIALDANNRNWNDFVSLMLIDAASGEEVRRLTHELPIIGDDYVWSMDGTRVYARVRQGGLDEIWAIPLNGEPRPIAQGPRRHFDLALSPDGAILSYQTEDGYGRKDIRILNLKSGEEEVVFILDEPANDFELGEWRHIRWKSTDGISPYGYLFLPPSFDPRRKYPMLVDVHGGGPGSRLSLNAPFTLGIAKGPLEWHAWAAMGYVVFVPDYRSTGSYGPKVIAARYKENKFAPIDDARDIISGVHYMIEQGFVDPARIAIRGHSAGAARVYWILTRHSKMFAAAILNEGTAPDPVSLVIGLSSGKHAGSFPDGIFQSVLSADLSDAPNVYKANYLFDAYRNTTPTLILMGNEDKGGVDHMPYEVIYSILKQNEVPTRFLSFVNEGHNYKSPAAAHLAFKEARKWLTIHMPANEQAISVN